MGISDEIEVATVAIDETTILEIKATTVLPFWSRLIWQHESSIAKKKSTKQGAARSELKL